MVPFTPQPQVLAHPAVKLFISHCGWGGVSDAIAAGVPVLAYPSFSDQFLNAARLVDLGAAILLEPDFSNLPASVATVSGTAAFSDAAARIGKEMQARGGLTRATHVIEAAAAGTFLEEAAELRQPMETLPPFLELPQHDENQTALLVLAVAVAAAGAVAMLVTACCCFVAYACFEQYCCDRRQRAVRAPKKTQ
jgi:hypothetical protein